MPKMHPNEVETDSALVRRLLQQQFPQWAELPLRAVPSAGTDNAIYRLGDALAVRLPRIDWAIGQIEKELVWMPKLAPHLPLTIPVPVAQGEPAEGYPWRWAVYQWLEGENATLEQIADPCQAARELAQFIVALQQIDTTAAPLAGPNSRGAPLLNRDANTRQALAALEEMIDVRAATAVWERALQAADWSQDPVWFHGDLLPGNLLFDNGRLSAVIDFSSLAVGDPACDLMIAWGLFAGESREVFRQTLAVDDDTWARGRGHALAQAAIFIPYYLHTNPVGVAYAQHMIANVLADYNANG
ncbi:MAG: aminoglycoside phosphotransferase family protein [Anaerolineales bacterium]|nr:aminoglycoside phosphotransferase family protein [Anaerolineales bacterium]